MSELNEKSINYGNLNRFLQDLRSHDLSDLEDKIDNIDIPEYSAGNGISISGDTISCTVKPIEDVDTLPDDEDSYNKIVRTNLSDIYVINHLEETENTPQLYPDFLQINNAYCAGGGDVDYYKGAYDLVCSDGTVHAFKWGSNNIPMISLKNAYDIHYKTDLTGDALFYISSRQQDGWQNNWTLNQTYAENLNVSVNDVLSNALSDSTDEYGIFKAVTYMPNESQIGNAYITYNNVDYFYTGEQTTITYAGIQESVYKLVNSEYSSFLGLTVPIDKLYKESETDTYTGNYYLYFIDGSTVTPGRIHLMSDNNIHIESGVLSWDKLVTEDKLTPISTELASKANKVDYIIPYVPLQGADWTVLNNVNTNGSYKGILRYSEGGVTLDMGTVDIYVVAAMSGATQQIFMRGADRIDFTFRVFDGTNWTTTDYKVPTINDTTSSTDNTYSSSKIDSLISALDQRITALGG